MTIERRIERVEQVETTDTSTGVEVVWGFAGHDAVKITSANNPDLVGQDLYQLVAEAHEKSAAQELWLLGFEALRRYRSSESEDFKYGRPSPTAPLIGTTWGNPAMYHQAAPRASTSNHDYVAFGKGSGGMLALSSNIFPDVARELGTEEVDLSFLVPPLPGREVTASAWVPIPKGRKAIKLGELSSTQTQAMLVKIAAWLPNAMSHSQFQEFRLDNMSLVVQRDSQQPDDVLVVKRGVAGVSEAEEDELIALVTAVNQTYATAGRIRKLADEAVEAAHQQWKDAQQALGSLSGRVESQALYEKWQQHLQATDE